MQQENDPSRSIKLGLMCVVAFMSWPVWLAAVSGFGHVGYGVWASALIPLALTLCVPLLAIHAGRRLARQAGRAEHAAEHALHIDGLLHHHS